MANFKRTAFGSAVDRRYSSIDSYYFDSRLMIFFILDIALHGIEFESQALSIAWNRSTGAMVCWCNSDSNVFKEEEVKND
jgi:hypothetical protein